MEAPLRLGVNTLFFLPGEVGGQANPSEIKDARTGAIIRPS